MVAKRNTDKEITKKASVHELLRFDDRLSALEIQVQRHELWLKHHDQMFTDFSEILHELRDSNRRIEKLLTKES